MGGIRMNMLTEKEVHQVSGAGAWDDFWAWVGYRTGDFLAESAYSGGSKTLHDIGSGSSGQSLSGFLADQNDPLL